MAAETMDLQVPDSVLLSFRDSRGLLLGLAAYGRMADSDNKCNQHDISCLVFAYPAGNACKADRGRAEHDEERRSYADRGYEASVQTSFRISGEKQGVPSSGHIIGDVR